MQSEAPATRAPMFGGFSQGMRHMLIASFFFSLMSVLVKIAGERLPSQQLVFARSIIPLVLSYIALKRAGVPIWGNHKKMLALRGILGFASLSCWFYALTTLPLADAVMIQFTNPILAAIIAAFWLGEALSPRALIAALLSMIGVVLIAQPAFLFGGAHPPGHALAYLAAMLGAIGSACVYVIVRKLRNSDHELVVVFYFPLIGTPLSLPGVVEHALWPTPLEWLLLLGIGICVQVAQVNMTKGLHLEAASRATSVSYVQIVLAFIWGMLLFNEYPNGYGIAGALLITFSVLWVAMGGKPPAPSTLEGAAEHSDDDADIRTPSGNA